MKRIAVCCIILFAAFFARESFGQDDDTASQSAAVSQPDAADRPMTDDDARAAMKLGKLMQAEDDAQQERLKRIAREEESKRYPTGDSDFFVWFVLLALPVTLCLWIGRSVINSLSSRTVVYGKQEPGGERRYDVTMTVPHVRVKMTDKVKFSQPEEIPSLPPLPLDSDETPSNDYTFRCAGCRQSLTIDASWRGSIVECPTCGKKIKVPSQRRKRQEPQKSAL